MKGWAVPHIVLMLNALCVASCESEDILVPFLGINQFPLANAMHHLL